MASTTLCDYQVLMGGSFTLDAAGTSRERTMHFEVPSDFEFGTGARRPILAFKITPLQTSRFSVFLNARKLTEPTFNKSNTRAYWEAFSAATAFPEGASFDNPAPLRIVMAQGRARFEDVIMWYQIKRDG
jgi:hypothetical protein